MKIIFYSKSRIHPALMAAVMAMAAMDATFAAGDPNGSPSSVSGSGSGSVAAVVWDATITAEVKSKLHGTGSLNNADIKVSNSNSVVTLNVADPNERAKSQAEQLARTLHGVTNVDDQLRLSGGGGELAKGERLVSDNWIITKGKSRIVADNANQGFKINVKTDNGVAILKGILPNEQDVQHVKNLAEQVKGVRRVDTSVLTASAR